MELLKRMLMRYMWIYERENGDRGIVLAKNYKDAIEKLSKVYPDTKERIKEKANNWMYVFDAGHIDIKGEIFITEPW